MKPFRTVQSQFVPASWSATTNQHNGRVCPNKVHLCVVCPLIRVVFLSSERFLAWRCDGLSAFLRALRDRHRLRLVICAFGVPSYARKVLRFSLKSLCVTGWPVQFEATFCWLTDPDVLLSSDSEWVYCSSKHQTENSQPGTIFYSTLYSLCTTISFCASRLLKRLNQQGLDLIELRLTWGKRRIFWLTYQDFWGIFEGFLGLLWDKYGLRFRIKLRFRMNVSQTSYDTMFVFAA